MRINVGIAAALGAAVLFGISAPLAKVLVATQPPLLMSGLLYVGSGSGLAIVLVLRSLRYADAPVRWPAGRDRWWLLGAIASGGIVGPYLLLVGLRVTDAASASLSLNLEGVCTALLAWLVFRENADWRIVLGMTLITVGGLVLSWAPAAAGGWGPIAIAAACFAWAVDNNLTRKVAASDALVIACTKGLVAGATSLGLAMTTGATLPSAAIAVGTGLLGFVCFGVSLTLFVIALRHLGSARTGAYFALAPFIGALLALGLGEPLTGTVIVAGLLMGVGAWLHVIEHHSHVHHHEALEHEHSHRHDVHHQHEHVAGWDGSEPHSHRHAHAPLTHSHEHYPDIHHRHRH